MDEENFRGFRTNGGPRPEPERSDCDLTIVAAVTLTGKVLKTDFVHYVGRTGDLTPQAKSKDLQKSKDSSTDIEIASLALSLRSSRKSKELSPSKTSRLNIKEGSNGSL